MKKLYESSEKILFTDSIANQLVNEGRESYSRFDLNSRKIIQKGASVFLFTWLGDAANEGIAAILRSQGLIPYIHGPVVEFFGSGASEKNVTDCINHLKESPMPDVSVLLEDSKNLFREKWDWALPNSLLKKCYASQYLDMEEAWAWIHKF
ncbi:hypothetical protein SDC9_150906 [bioreactor metagenome]|uniref:Uncharacterized protein n=1 Tax=bioreactor metagenome TaxID=1076179 RepID=A0A645ET47_9ZZZZ